MNSVGINLISYSHLNLSVYVLESQFHKLGTSISDYSVSERMSAVAVDSVRMKKVEFHRVRGNYIRMKERVR